MEKGNIMGIFKQEFTEYYVKKNIEESFSYKLTHREGRISHLHLLHLPLRCFFLLFVCIILAQLQVK